MRTRAGRKTGAAVALMIAMPAVAPASASAPQPFEHDGVCEQVGAVVMVDSERLAPWIPSGFPTAGVLGRSPLLVTGGRCEGHVGGVAVPPNHWGLVAVPSSHPDDPLALGAHAYDLWWLNSERLTARGWRGLGIRSERARRTRLRREGDELTLAASAARRFPFTVSVKEADAPGVAMALQTFHWHLGSHGRVLVDPEHSGLTLDGGPARITAPAGSPLAEILGATAVTAPGGVLRFSFWGIYGPG